MRILKHVLQLLHITEERLNDKELYSTLYLQMTVVCLIGGVGLQEESPPPIRDNSNLLFRLLRKSVVRVTVDINTATPVRIQSNTLSLYVYPISIYHVTSNLEDGTSYQGTYTLF